MIEVLHKLNDGLDSFYRMYMECLDGWFVKDLRDFSNSQVCDFVQKSSFV